MLKKTVEKNAFIKFQFKNDLAIKRQFDIKYTTDYFHTFQRSALEN